MGDIELINFICRSCHPRDCKLRMLLPNERLGYCKYLSTTLPYLLDAIKGAGYHKIDTGKLTVLSDEEIECAVSEFCSYLEGHRQALREIAQAQLALTIKQIEEA